MPPTVLFDLDGTLTDPREGILASLRFAFEGLGATPPPERVLLAAIGPPLAETFRELLPTPSPAALERAIALYRERFDDGGWRENRLLPETPLLLAEVEQRGWRAAIVTSKLERFARRIADHFELQPPIERVYGSQPGGRWASKPALLAHVLEQLGPRGAASAQIAMVGDRRHDVEAAHSASIASVGVTWGFGDRAELEGAGARWICDSAPEVLTSLERCFSRS